MEEQMTRSSRHQKKGQSAKKTKQLETFNNAPKKSGWGKHLFTLISIIVVLMVAGGAYFFYEAKKQEAQAQDRFEHGAEELLKTIQAERDQSGIASQKKETNSNQLKTVVYLPEKPEQLPIPDSQQTLTDLVAKAKKEIKDSGKHVVVGKLAVNALSDQVDVYKLVAENYPWDAAAGTFTKAKTLEGSSQYIYHKTGQPVSSSDLIPEEADLLGIQQVIQQKILDQEKDKEASIDQVLNMPRITRETPIVYTPEKLKLTLPTNETGVSELELEYKDIAPFINTALVDPKTLTNDQIPALDPNKKYVALTFDDGPNPATTPQILDILKAKQATATFFLLGQNVEANQELVKRIVDEGNEVGSHSYSHARLNTLSDEEVKAEIIKTDKAIFEASGVLPQNLRAPYGAADQRVATIAGKPLIHWSVDSQDWESKNPVAIEARLQATLYEGSIVLMHDIQPATLEALPQVIDTMRAEGYEFVSVDTMLQKSQKPLYTYFGDGDFRIIP
ncbi:polysaccharide deacetylase family protein [Enterococcus asini]|uniref:polysaccharide deacetylase family protein n=1 Tax=Enterococcus asini TaxID=57732 RepID=UPI00288FD792|nr:polysaccharide deacetylase family protein [Enterococcus asini]MDT2757930.1 polysaccharide deacetylase family protein [Enterococcus asini]